MSRRAEEVVDTLRCYLRDVRRFPPLEPEEEERLAHRLEEGRRATAALDEPGLSPERRGELAEHERQGRQARDRIVLAYLRLVVPLARRYARRGRLQGLELADLIQEGNLGLLAAVEEFEPGHGMFATFALPWVRRKISRALSQQSRVVRIPAHLREKLDRLRREEDGYLAEKGRPPTPEELAAKLGIDTAELETLRLAEQEVVSLDQPVPGREEETFYEDLLADPQATAFAERTADRQWLDWLLAGLDERGRRVLKGRLGHDLTLEEVGSRESVTPQRIRQIEREALASVRGRFQGVHESHGRFL